MNANAQRLIAASSMLLLFALTGCSPYGYGTTPLQEAHRMRGYAADYPLPVYAHRPGFWPGGHSVEEVERPTPDPEPEATEPPETETMREQAPVEPTPGTDLQAPIPPD